MHLISLVSWSFFCDSVFSAQNGDTKLQIPLDNLTQIQSILLDQFHNCTIHMTYSRSHDFAGDQLSHFFTYFPQSCKIVETGEAYLPESESEKRNYRMDDTLQSISKFEHCYVLLYFQDFLLTIQTEEGWSFGL